MMYDLGVGTPLGLTALAYGLAGLTSGYVLSITPDPQWWLAAIFVGVGAAAGEAAVPVVRRFIGEQDAFVPEMSKIIPVVAIGAAIASLALVPISRWALRLGRPEWKLPADE
jgi:hypothetical protein